MLFFERMVEDTRRGRKGLEHIRHSARRALEECRRAMEARKDGSERREGSEELKRQMPRDDAASTGNQPTGGVSGRDHAAGFSGNGLETCGRHCTCAHVLPSLMHRTVAGVTWYFAAISVRGLDPSNDRMTRTSVSVSFDAPDFSPWGIVP